MNWRAVVAGAILVSLTLPVGACALLGPSRTDTLIKQGGALLDKGSYEKAEAVFKQAVAADPKSVSAHANLADAYVYLGKTDLAIAESNKAIALDPKSALGYAELGTALLDAGRLDEAATALNMAISRDPKDSDSIGNLAAVYVAQGFMKLAEPQAAKASKLDPSEPAHYANLAAALYWEGADDKAIAAATKAVSLDADSPQAHEYLAAAYIRRDDNAGSDKDKAVSEARLAVKYSFNESWPYALLANALANKKQWADAGKQARLALALDPTQTRALGIYAWSAYRAKDYKTAVDYANRALVQDDQHGDTYYLLGMVWHDQGRLDRAIANMAEAARLDPQSAITKTMLASFEAEKAARSRAIQSRIEAIAKRLAAERAARARAAASSNTSLLLSEARAYVRAAFGWSGARASLSSRNGDSAVVRMSAPGRGWMNVYLYRVEGGTWLVKDRGD